MIVSAVSKLLMTVRAAHETQGKGVPEPPEPTDAREVVDRSGTQRRYGCGHDDAESFALNVYGERIRLSAKFFSAGRFYGDCAVTALLRGSVRCAIATCRRIIALGDRVAIYPAVSQDPHVGHVTGGMLRCNRNDCRTGFPVGRLMPMGLVRF